MDKIELFSLPLYVKNISGRKNNKDYEFIVYESVINGTVVNFVPVERDKRLVQVLVNNVIDTL